MDPKKEHNSEELESLQNSELSDTFDLDEKIILKNEKVKNIFTNKISDLTLSRTKISFILMTLTIGILAPIFIIGAIIVIYYYTVMKTSSVSFLWFSDIHYEPYYNETASCFSLCRNEITTWNSVPCGDYNNSIKDVKKEFGRYGCNTPLTLLRESIKQMKKKQESSNYKFGILSGDIISHGLSEIVQNNQDRNQQLYSINTLSESIENSLDNDFYYDEFIGRKYREALNTLNQYERNNILTDAKTRITQAFRTVIEEISSVFNDIPIFLTIGNNDVVHDYQWPLNDDWIYVIYNGFKHLWSNYSYINDSEFISSKLGVYTVLQLPDLQNTRLISFNSLVYSPKIQQSQEVRERAIWQLSWIENQLKITKENNQKVLLLYHIPIGANGYSENQRQWVDEYEKEFLRISELYKETIIAHLCGHFHFESFKLLGNNENPFGTLLVSPSITPFFFNNPSYRVFNIRKQTQTLEDYQNYFLDIEKQEDNQNFVKQYQFTESYNLNDLSVSSMFQLYKKIWIENDFSILASYFFRSRSSFMPKKPEYKCAMYHQQRDQFDKCVKQQNVGIVPNIRIW